MRIPSFLPPYLFRGTSLACFFIAPPGFDDLLTPQPPSPAASSACLTESWQGLQRLCQLV